VIAVESVLREMIRYATRWPINRRGAVDPAADSFFAVIETLVTEAFDNGLPLFLPAAKDPVAAAVIELTMGSLATANLAEICAAYGVSTRTLRRRIGADLGMSWTDFVTQARLLRAMTLLVLTAACSTSPLPLGSPAPAGSQERFESSPTQHRRHTVHSITKTRCRCKVSIFELRMADRVECVSALLIIVLGAPNDDEGALGPIAQGRVVAAEAVHHSLPGSVILPTGGFGAHFNRSPLAHHELLRRHLVASGVDPGAILPGVDSTNTSEDAELGSEVVRALEPREVVIVTSDFHHERASLLFARCLPERTVRFELASTQDLGDDLRTALIAHEAQAVRRLT
jgi:AraC-like DNA-binding protein